MTQQLQARDDRYEQGQREFAAGTAPRLPADADYMDGWQESADISAMCRRPALDPTLLPAFRALFERGPASDPHIEAFRRLCERDVKARTIGWYRVEIESVCSRQRHFVDVQGADAFEATREAMAQNKHASSAKVVRRYYDGEALLGNW